MVKTLWLLECADRYWMRLFPFYAVDGCDARKQADSYLTFHPHLIEEKLHEQPQGFVLMFKRLPGHIQA